MLSGGHSVNLGNGGILHTHFGDCEEELEHLINLGLICRHCGVAIDPDFEHQCT